MASGEAMSARYTFGVGARTGVDALELAALLRGLAVLFDVNPQAATLATLDARENEQGIHAAARILKIEVVFLSLDDLRARRDDVLTYSPRIIEMFGVGSVAEAAALAGAGEGSLLLAPRIASARLTCAIARGREGDERK
jgi:cobalamin biosynthesis protein CbiG